MTRQAPEPPRAPSQPGRLLRVLLALCLGAAALPGAARAEEDGTSIARLLAGLRSPLRTQREAAEAELVARGPAAAAVLRRWAADEDGRLRASAWRVLARVGDGSDTSAAVAALSDADPEVAETAAAALVEIVEREPAPAEPWLGRDALDGRATRALASALGVRFARSAPGTLPACFYRLGEGVLPCLEQICRHARYNTYVRSQAILAMARIGGSEGRRALASLAPRKPEREDGAPLTRADRGWYRAFRRFDLTTWWQALQEVGPGQGLAPVQDVVVALAIDGKNHRRGGLGLGSWRELTAYYRFVAACPPFEGVEHVRELLAKSLRYTARSRGSPLPSMLVAAIRAHLVVSEPTEDTLRLIVLSARGSYRSRRRAEELGAVLGLLEPYRERPGVQEALEEILAADAAARKEDSEYEQLPKTVRAWARYLHGEADPADLREEATALVDSDGGAATMAQRRLGVQLWNRLGEPPLALVRSLYADLDPWMRASAIRWALHAVRDGRMPAEELAGVVARGLRETDPSVLLLSAESSQVPLPAEAREAILKLAVEGARRVRGRAWAVLARAAARRPGTAGEPFEPPRSSASLDERIRAAAALRRCFGD